MASSTSAMNGSDFGRVVASCFLASNDYGRPAGDLGQVDVSGHGYGHWRRFSSAWKDKPVRRRVLQAIRNVVCQRLQPDPSSEVLPEGRLTKPAAGRASTSENVRL